MGRTYWFFTLGCLALSIYFYTTPLKVFSMLFLLIFVACMYGAGKLG